MKKLRQKFRKSLKYFYSWPASIVAANLSFLIGNLIIFGRLFPKDEVPSYANAVVNITTRFPLWILFTFIITTSFVFLFQNKATFIDKLVLIIMNGVTWILSGIILLILYFVIPISWGVLILLPSELLLFSQLH